MRREVHVRFCERLAGLLSRLHRSSVFIQERPERVPETVPGDGSDTADFGRMNCEQDLACGAAKIEVNAIGLKGVTREPGC